MNNVQQYIINEAETQLEKGVATLIVGNTVGYSDKNTVEYMENIIKRDALVVGLTHESDSFEFFNRYYRDIEEIRKNNLEWMDIGSRDLINYLVLNSFEYVVGNMLNSIELEQVGA